MTKVTGNIQIDAPRDKVWNILADLETVKDYDSEIINAFYISENREGVGAARQCDLPDGGYIKERITEWNPGQGYSLIVDEGTGTEFFESQVVRFGLKNAGQGTIVSLELEYELKSDAPANPHEMENEYRELVNGVVSGLKRYAEAGQTSPMTHAFSGDPT